MHQSCILSPGGRQAGDRELGSEGGFIKRNYVGTHYYGTQLWQPIHALGSEDGPLGFVAVLTSQSSGGLMECHNWRSLLLPGARPRGDVEPGVNHAAFCMNEGSSPPVTMQLFPAFFLGGICNDGSKFVFYLSKHYY